MTLLDIPWIRAHIPHRGTMCLLDSVRQWDSQSILCTAIPSLRQEHPLHQEGKVSSLVGIEYAAQAMAVHGVLLRPEAPSAPPGMLSSVRHIHWSSPHLNLSLPLTIRAQRLASLPTACTYSFRITNPENLLITGQASIFFGLPQMPTSAGETP